MAAKLVTAPATEPVTIAEQKLHSRVDITDDDDLIAAQIAAARRWLEGVKRRAFITQTWRLNLDAWPVGNEIALPNPPLQSVSSIKYYDESNNETTWNNSNYLVDTDSEPGRVVLAYNKTWPTEATLYPVNPIRIEFVAGYGAAADVPETDKQAIMLLVGHWYENRETTMHVDLRTIPFAVESLMWFDRNF